MIKSQKGSSLIVVLIILVMITAIGVYAIRQGMTNLQVSTNMQLQKLLMQSTDSALQAIERDFSVREATDFANTPIGQVTRDGSNGQELEFCYKPGSNPSVLFTLKDFRMIERAGTATTGVDLKQGNINKGYCDASSMFNSARNAMVTQVTVVLPDDPVPDVAKYGLSSLGNELKNIDIDTKRIRVIATTIAPVMALGATTSQINTCLKDRVGDVMAVKNTGAESKTECLNNLGVPFNTQVADLVVRLNQTGSRMS